MYRRISNLGMARFTCLVAPKYHVFEPKSGLVQDSTAQCHTLTIVHTTQKAWHIFTLLWGILLAVEVSYVVHEEIYINIHVVQDSKELIASIS